MNRTRRTIGLTALVMLVGVGTGWTLAKASSNSPAKGGAAVSEPASNAGTRPVSREPADVPASHYDRSDLLLSQG
jgi:hypothetical protein